MKKLFLVLIMLLVVVSSTVSKSEPFKGPDPGETPVIQRSFVWKVCVELSFPFGTVERNIKTKQVYRIIYTNELELDHGFVLVNIPGRESRRLLIPNDRVLYILQMNMFHGWDTIGGTE